MTKQQLIEAYQQNTIGKQQLGQLRRMVLTDLLKSVVSNPALAKTFLKPNGNKLDRAKLAKEAGFGLKAVNISQSFKSLVEDTEAALKAEEIIHTDTDAMLRQKSMLDFKQWLEERIANPAYQWPVNNKNKIYRRVLWAFYLDTDPAEIMRPGAIMNEDDIKETLAELDVKVVRQEVQTLDYAAASALEEMSETMQSKAISKLTAETKELKEKLTNANEELRRLRHQLKVYEARDESLLHADIKGAGIH
ncbi:MAG: hypothetical protein GJ680_19270 [Alteromonadaceae bacterium]|nr:hypothetical protein [Alteromonadaceae bacterium]